MRRGFTLLEVIVALTIAGLIALAARATIVGGLDTQDRLLRRTAADETETRFRALVVQALRHATDAPTPVTAPFVVRDTVLSDAASQLVEFYSRGFGLPPGSGRVSRVRLAPGSDGLTLSVESLEGSLLLTGTLPDAGRLTVQAKMPAGEWLAVWPPTLQLPAAVAVTYVVRSAPRSPEPVVVSTHLEPHP